MLSGNTIICQCKGLIRLWKGSIKNATHSLIAGRSVCVHFLSKPLADNRVRLDKKCINREGTENPGQEADPISAGKVAGEGENLIAPESLDGNLKEQDDE